MVATETEYLLQSPDASWCAERWEKLPADGNRYEVIDGVLYMSTSPSVFHQWIISRLMRLVGFPLQDDQLAYAFTSPDWGLYAGLRSGTTRFPAGSNGARLHVF